MKSTLFTAAAAVLMCALLTGGVRAAEAEDVAALMTERWFEAEVVIFERLGTADEVDGEVLYRHDPRALQQDLLALVDGSDYPWELQADTLDEALNFRLGRARDFALPDRRLRNTPLRRQAVTETEGNAEILTESQAAEKPPSPRELFLRDVTEFEQGLRARAWRTVPDHALTEQTAKLQRGNRHRILWHQRWLQAAPERGAAIPVLVQSGERWGPRFELEGTLGLSIGRYLHMDAKLWLQEPPLLPVSEEEPSMAELVSDAAPEPIDTLPAFAQPEYRYMALEEHRRLRSNELHYLDHPRFGVLLLVQPVAIPVELTAGLDAVQAAEAEANNARR